MEAWLRGLRLEQYTLKLCTGGFVTLDDCSKITEPDLINLDVLPGHRKRILMNIPVPGTAPQQEEEEEEENVYANFPTSSRHARRTSADSSVYTPPSKNGLVGHDPLDEVSRTSSGDVYDVPVPQAVDEGVYDVPVPRPRKSSSQTPLEEESEDEEYYVNVADLIRKPRPPSPPPDLPKKSLTKRQSIDEMFGIVPPSPTESGSKKPVPAPRRTTRSASTGNLRSAGVSLDAALMETPEETISESPQRPVPKPRNKKSLSATSLNAPHSDSSTSFTAHPEMSSAVPEETDDMTPAAGSTAGDAVESADSDEHTYDEPASPVHKDASPASPVHASPASPVHKDASPDEGISSSIEDFAQDDIYEPVGEPTVPHPVTSHIKEQDLYIGGFNPTNSSTPAAETPQKPVMESQPGYDPVWVSSSRMSYGAELMPVMEPTIMENSPLPRQEADKGAAVKKRPPLRLPPQTTEDVPGIFSLDQILCHQFSPDSRESIVSFCEPPPNFTPPPLPPGVSPPSLVAQSGHVTAPKPASGPPMMRPLSHTDPAPPSSVTTPPVIPPRPKTSPKTPESPKTEERRARSRSGSSSSVTTPGLKTLVPPIPEEGPLLESGAVVYDTAAEALGPMVYMSGGSDYTEVGVSGRSAAGRVSPVSFTDLAGHRAAQGACAHPERPDAKHPAPPERSTSYTSEENIYVDGPTRAAPPAPVPPPRVKPLSALQEQCALDRDVSFSNTSKNLADLESDDTLSDGGEFLESELRHLRPSVLQTSIPIVPATPNSIKERKGYLYKLPSRRSQKRVGWRKRWVTFDGEELIYYSDEKSVVSKRIIPLNTIVNVEQQIKGSPFLRRKREIGDMHPYEFKLTTIDRVYRFAADDGDDLTLWTSILMRAIIDSKPEKFEEGGCMSLPDKEGFVRMEGLKGRQYLVIKKDKFCYYNTFSDYKMGTPIHRVALQLASVKDSGKSKLLLMTPTVSFGLLCESEAELSSWKEAFEEGIAEGLGDDTILKEVYENQNNRLCADCGAPDPHWASVNLGITLCKQCAGIHRMLSAPTSKVRSLRMDFRVWTPTLIQMLQKIGNDNSNNYWEWNSSEDDRIDSDADMSSRQEYILAKYRDKRYFRFHPLKSDAHALNEALCKSVQYGDVLETLQALYSGADILCTSSSYGAQRETPLQLARKSKQTLQAEFLYQNGAEAVTSHSVQDPLSGGASQGAFQSHMHTLVMKGYLHKLQSNQREYNRRYFVLERGVLSYFESDKSTVARDSIERKEMMSVGITSDDKFEFGFEVGTTKGGGRVFTMATDTDEERHQWIVKLAKSFAPLPSDSLDKIKDLDRGGLIFLREGATTDWQMTWMHMKKKKLYIFKKDEQKFEEIDLRKVTGTKTLQRTDLCLETFDDGPPFVIDLPNRAFYIQGDTRSETESWYRLISKVSTETSGYLVGMQLTADNVPVIVDKCVNFISAHGMRMEGLYRLNGQHSKVGQLLEEFQSNAQNVFLSLDLYQVHDVATALKRLFRTLEEPLLTTDLFQRWLETSHMTENGPKMQWYKYLLGELPTVHYATLKRLIIHMARVASFEVENKMSEINLASIFGPILMKVDKDSTGQTGYGSTTQEITVILDLIGNHKWLFEIKDDELEHERKIQEAVDKIGRVSRENQRMRESLAGVSPAGDLLIGIYVNSHDGDVVSLKVSATMTTQEVLQYVESKANLDASVHWGIYEVICQEQLERPLHYLERVLDVNLRWSRWSSDFSKDNYLVVKPNVVIDKVQTVFDPHFSLFNEFKFSDKKGFKKYYFEFSKYKLSYQKDTRATNPIASWNIEELVLYSGIEHKRGAPTKWGITFINGTEKITKSKDAPFFGHSISCLSDEEMYRWLAAMLHAQHPGGLVPEGMKYTPPSNDPPLPIAVEQPDTAVRLDASRPKKGFFQKLSRW